jgi:bifunctional UDP-N-acetylglucosamine pyrophosphorylase / glucosamine-1-phosphate N-acetyltransferase
MMSQAKVEVSQYPKPFTLPTDYLVPASQSTVVEIHTTAIVDESAVLGEGVTIGAYCLIGANVTIEANTRVLPFTIVVDGVRIGSHCQLGPFAHIREGVTIGNNVRVGNFVELKACELHDWVATSHLTYVGDAIIGAYTNVGAGTITANYNSVAAEKNLTVIEPHVSVGANCTLVAPVTVKEHAVIGAGSTITKEVPEHSLAIARGKQTVLPNWVKTKKKSLSSFSS